MVEDSKGERRHIAGSDPRLLLYRNEEYNANDELEGYLLNKLPILASVFLESFSHIITHYIFKAFVALYVNMHKAKMLAGMPGIEVPKSVKANPAKLANMVRVTPGAIAYVISLVWK